MDKQVFFANDEKCISILSFHNAVEFRNKMYEIVYCLKASWPGCTVGVGKDAFKDCIQQKA